jgi:hypothetical protein
MEFKDIGRGYMDWIYVAQIGALVNMTINLQVS